MLEGFKKNPGQCTHCYGHSVSLTTCDAVKLIKGALETTYEIKKLIKYSPRREGIFKEVKSAHDTSTDNYSPGVHVLCSRFSKKGSNGHLNIMYF